MHQPDSATPPAQMPNGLPPAQPPSRSRRWWVGVAVVLVLAALAGGSYYLVNRPAEDVRSATAGPPGARPGPPGGGGTVTVGHAVAVQADLPITLDALGTVTPLATITLKPQVGGVLTDVLFTEGQMVAKGQLLARIDPRPYEQALAQARGGRMRDEAQLEAARVTLGRFRTLLGEDSIARQDVDTQAALVKQLEGTVVADKASEGAAAVNLEYTRITAPVTGRIGLRAVDPGNTVTSGSTTGIAVITQMNPIDVQFAVPQDRVPDIQGEVASGRKLGVVALDRTRSEQLGNGTFSTLDNVVDTTTGTVKAKARFSNADGKLFPSQFVNVRVTLRTLSALVVPVTAVRSGPNGAYVYVIGEDRTVSIRTVKRGVSTVDVTAITEGLKGGEMVVTEGGDRLSEGSRVALQGERRAAGPRQGNGGPRQQQEGGSTASGAGAPASGASAAGAAPAPRPTAPGGTKPAPAATGAGTALPSAEQRQRMLDSVRDNPEQLERRKQFLQQLDKGDPAALERWQRMQQRMRDGGGPGGQGGSASGG